MKKEIDDVRSAAKKVEEEKVAKEAALQKLQEKSTQDDESAYKKLIDSVPKGNSLAEQTPDQVYELAANIIETNPKYGVADVSTIGQEELVGNSQVIRLDNSTAEAHASVVQQKLKAAAKPMTKELADAPKSADRADDFDNIQVAESADSANSADQFASVGDDDEDEEDDEDDDTQVQQSTEMGAKAGVQTDAAAFQIFKNRLDKHPEDLIEALPKA
jgi:hypothetical protein